MKYPCSYTLYSDAFHALPQQSKDLIYRRLWAVLSGQLKEAKYERLSSNDRTTIVEILRDTVSDLPAYFR
jgi:hypothetical protein